MRWKRVLGSILLGGSRGHGHLRPLYGSRGEAGSCGSEGWPPQDSATATTDGAGSFNESIRGVSIDGPLCVEIAVTPDSTSTLAPRVDSIRAEFVLPGETPPRTDVTVTLDAR
ncbi:hypothetical protein [Gaopeijia maritima]|uniref:Uncharacterized protein n=1 Tax=Gaopeijia maritima TaxID=3119007 RepID=A0ABU9EAE9_9BACT